MKVIQEFSVRKKMSISRSPKNFMSLWTLLIKDFVTTPVQKMFYSVFLLF